MGREGGFPIGPNRRRCRFAALAMTGLDAIEKLGPRAGSMKWRCRAEWSAYGATSLTLTTASPSPSRSPVSRTGTPTILQSCTAPPSVWRPKAASVSAGASAASIASSAALIALAPGVDGIARVEIEEELGLERALRRRRRSPLIGLRPGFQLEQRGPQRGGDFAPQLHPPRGEPPGVGGRDRGEQGGEGGFAAHASSQVSAGVAASAATISALISSRLDRR